MSVFKLLLRLLLLLLIPMQMLSQKDHSIDKSLINQTLITMFDGMREGDSAKVHSVFRDDIRTYTSVKNKNGTFTIREDKLNSFLIAVGTPHTQIWNEELDNTIIQMDRNIAQVWTDYSFYIDAEFSHCGTDAFQLVKEKGKWKIVSLMDTRRKEGCK